MASGVAMMAVGILLLYITPGAAKQNLEINRYLARFNFRSFPRLRRWNIRAAERREGADRIWGTAVGLLGVVGGLILIGRALRA